MKKLNLVTVSFLHTLRLKLFPPKCRHVWGDLHVLKCLHCGAVKFENPSIPRHQVCPHCGHATHIKTVTLDENRYDIHEVCGSCGARWRFNKETWRMEEARVRE